MDISRHWRLRKERYALVGEICEACGNTIFPPRDICPKCGAEARTPFTFSGKGEVYSFSTVYDAPAGFESNAPYTIALIKLAEGPILTAQLTDVDNDKAWIGMPVEMVTRKLSEGGRQGVINYGYKFRPVLRQPKAAPVKEAAVAATA